MAGFDFDHPNTGRVHLPHSAGRELSGGDDFIEANLAFLRGVHGI